MKIAVSQGPFAALFVALLFWVLKENAKREERLMGFFERMEASLGEMRVEVERGFMGLDGKLDRVLNHVKGD